MKCLFLRNMEPCWENSAGDILKYFSYFPPKIGFNIDYNQFCAFPNKAALKWLICATTE